MNILDEIIQNKIIQINVEKAEKPLGRLVKREVRDFQEALSKKGISVIAEIKKASPSKGLIAEDFDPIKTARIYEKADVAAISVLTEKKYFLGNDEYVNLVKSEVTKPVLRKDFIVDEYQIQQSYELGADVILLIVSVLKDKLKDYYEKATKLGLHCLVEVHDKAELDIALESGCKIIGINNRNLSSFQVDLKTTADLMKFIPKDKIVVSESGINSLEDIKYLKSIGVHAVLIGESFMRKPENLKSFLEECNND